MTKLAERRIRYEAELDRSFAEEMTERIGNDSIRHCIQCGTCSATCPVTLYMDYTPRRIVAMTREGFKDDVLKSVTPWICASCYSCTVECPKDVKITELMYAIKRKAIEEDGHRYHVSIPALAKEFFHSVISFGRINEGNLMTRFLLKTNPFKLIGNSSLGIRLFSKGRMEIGQDRIKNITQLKQLLKAVDEDKPTPVRGS